MLRLVAGEDVSGDLGRPGTLCGLITSGSCDSIEDTVGGFGATRKYGETVVRRTCTKSTFSAAEKLELEFLWLQ